MPAAELPQQPGSVSPDAPEIEALAALFAGRRYAEAATIAREMTARFPLHGFGWKALGAALKQMGQNVDAAAAMQRAVELWPNDAEAHSNLGVVLKERGLLHEAEASCQRALGLRPDLAAAHSNLGAVLTEQGRLEEAEASCRRALELAPDLLEAHNNLLFVLNYHPDRTAAEVFPAFQQFEERFGRPLRAHWQPHANVADPERRLRVGYVSADFRDHSVAFFIEPVLANHDRDHFEVFCYYNFPHADAVTRRLKTHADHWRGVETLGDDAFVALVRTDLIDVLVDLNGHTTHNRLLAMARKPAPVQATWLGYLNTTGLQAMDYRITDAYASPEGMLDDWHSERLVRLPDSQWCYRPPAECPAVGPLPKAIRGHVTFASFTTRAKVNARVIELWSRLLREVPESRLLVVAHGPAADPIEFLEPFKRLGIPAERLQLTGSRPFLEYLSLHNSVDIVLDTFPYAGGTTTCHALWMGVPVVALAGGTAPSRGGASLLNAVGLGELAANSPREYLQFAADLARDTQRLAALRAGLRERMRVSPLMDEKRFARNLENAYRKMWRNHCLSSRR